MRAVFGLVLVLGLGLAGFAVYMVKDYMSAQEVALQRERQRAAQNVDTIEVYTVTRAVAYGEPLTIEDVAAIPYALNHLPEGVFKTEEELFPQGTDVTRVALRAMEPNEPITAVKVTDPGQPAGITSRLARGMRAFTIKVDVSTGVSGFLRPGDRVDIYWTGLVGGGQGTPSKEITRLIESGVELIAVDQSADANLAGNTIAGTVTVQATPQEVANLTQAQSSGSLTLALVGADDETIANVIEVDQMSLLGIEEIIPEAPAPQAEAPRTCSIRTRRGAEVVDLPIPCTN